MDSNSGTTSHKMSCPLGDACDAHLGPFSCGVCGALMVHFDVYCSACRAVIMGRA